MQVYDEMVDTGVAWIGKTPYGWDVKKFNSLYRQTNAGEVIPKEFWDKTGAYLMYTASQKPIRSIFPDFPETKLTTENDILIARNGDGVIHNPQAGSIYTNVVQRVTLDPNIVIKSFLIYALKASLVYVHGQSNGDFIVSLNMGMWNNTRLPVPSMQAQQKIADFLDTETAKIDNLIAKQERLLQLLEEKRRATITHAVTRGLDPNVELKETNIPWLGKVPEHWELKKLKHVGKSIIGLTYSPADLADTGTLVLRSMNISNGKINTGTQIFVSKSIPEKLLTIKGDLLICSRNGSRRLIGKCGLIEKSQEGHTFGVFNTIFRSEYNDFIYYTLNSNIFYAQLGLFMTSTINQLTVNTLNNFEIGLPDRDEQRQIVELLNEHEHKSEILKEKIQTQINLLRERRTSLISHAVTGKIKV